MGTANNWLLRGGTLVTVDETQPVLTGDLLIIDGAIAALGTIHPDDPRLAGVQVRDVTGCVVLPGLVQAHIHLCQTLGRGLADDLPLLRWLKERVLPYEAALDENDIALAAQVGIAELLLSGTTNLLDMGTVRHHDALCTAVAKTGIRATLGKAMMDHPDTVPANLRETTEASLREADELCQRWHGHGRLRYGYAPRFLVSCSDSLMRGVAERVTQSSRQGPGIHTHASEQRDEVALIRDRTGQDNVAALRALGVGGPRTVLAHCVHVTEKEISHLQQDGTHVTHCPSSNLKLGSGIAPVARLLAEKVDVALGADGAPCNNRLDGFAELRLMAILQKGLLGPEVLPAKTALRIATLGGAKALGQDDVVGSLTQGKRADVVVVGPHSPGQLPAHDPVSMLVYATQGSDVKDVFVDGELLVASGELTPRTGLDVERLRAECADRMPKLLRRAGIAC
ncbi:MAG TPA: amidohydrolase family protein [Pseudomonadota bacterium]|nr:amidohydrolase family protein [Pseudomonadota bacterium]